MRRGIWACAAAVAGCAVGPDHTEPTPELAASFIEAAPSAYTEAPVPSALWASFGDPDLDALIELALERSAFEASWAPLAGGEEAAVLADVGSDGGIGHVALPSPGNATCGRPAAHATRAEPVAETGAPNAGSGAEGGT